MMPIVCPWPTGQVAPNGNQLQNKASLPHLTTLATEPTETLSPGSRIWDRPRLTVNLVGIACGPTQSSSTKGPPTTSHSRGLGLP